MATTNSASNRVQRALHSIRQHTDMTADLAVVLGSGLGDYAEQIDGLHIPFSEIDGFPLSTAPNHKGVLHIGMLHGRSVVALQGRLHLYEGHSAQDAAFPIEVAQALGATASVLTNVSGSLNANYVDGEIIGISDHIYLPGLTGNGALVGRKDNNTSPFANLTHAYDREWLDKADQSDIGSLKRGVYACLAGPHFETPAEGRMLRSLGADMVGMSTIHETVMARYLDMKVLGLSLVVNPVITDPDNQPAFDEAEIWKTVETAQAKFAVLLNHVILTAPTR